MRIMISVAACLALSSDFVGAQGVDSDATRLLMAGRRLTAQEVETIKTGLKGSPDDLVV